MTDKEFRHLNRRDLIEIIYELKLREKELEEQLEKAKNTAYKRITPTVPGSIAGEAVRVGGILEAAQKTADEYIARIKAADAATERRCRAMVEQTERECRKKVEDTDKIIAQTWQDFYHRANEAIDGTENVTL